MAPPNTSSPYDIRQNGTLNPICVEAGVPFCTSAHYIMNSDMLPWGPQAVYCCWLVGARPNRVNTQAGHTTPALACWLACSAALPSALMAGQDLSQQGMLSNSHILSVGLHAVWSKQKKHLDQEVEMHRSWAVDRS